MDYVLGQKYSVFKANCPEKIHLKWTLTYILSLYSPYMKIFLRLGHFLWFLDFENPSINKDFMAFKKIW